MVAPGRPKLLLEPGRFLLCGCLCFGMGSGSRGLGWSKPNSFFYEEGSNSGPRLHSFHAGFQRAQNGGEGLPSAGS